MPKFLVENGSDKPLKVAIEPWAMVEILAPEAKAYFECSEPTDVEFSVGADGSVCVGVPSEWITVAANGGEWSFGKAENL